MVDVRTPPRPPGAAPPRRSRWHWSTIPLLVAIAAGLAVLAYLFATADDEPSSGPRPTATTTPSPTMPTTVDPQAATKAAILDAYRQSYDAVIAVGSDPNGQPTDPRLEQHAIGNALLASQASIDRLRKAGHVLQGTIELHPEVVELTVDSAVVEDCSVDRLSIVNAATGEVVTPADPSPEGGRARATYKLLNGVWMQNSFRDLKQPCVPTGS